jgi:hypothetical protein
VINEPHGQDNPTLANMYNGWLNRYPGVPRQRVILDGNNTAQDPNVVGQDNRLNGTRIAIHYYAFFRDQQPDSFTEAGWAASLAEMITPYANRTVVTEWGAQMSPLTSSPAPNYQNPDPVNPDPDPAHFSVDYLRGGSTELRNTAVGSVYWPGWRINDSFSMLSDPSIPTATTPIPPNPTITLTVNNAGGLSQLRKAWGF